MAWSHEPTTNVSWLFIAKRAIHAIVPIWRTYARRCFSNADTTDTNTATNAPECINHSRMAPSSADVCAATRSGDRAE